MLTPESLRTNAYRVLQLSANASLSEVHQAGATLRRTAILGLVGTGGTDFPTLGAVAREEADVRAATGRLENLPQRLNDRLFWFHQVDCATRANASRPASTIKLG
jgi:hypothetical protein